MIAITLSASTYNRTCPIHMQCMGAYEVNAQSNLLKSGSVRHREVVIESKYLVSTVWMIKIRKPLETMIMYPEKGCT